ncbi:hypothetical protein QE152_g33402 [Popillia japonica]|uniref:GTP cyclohydrolase 1 feedback regulatory protein n=1 Tax=Popillia japonica TaxID=7064 RepID=A0AAW1IWF4_POPJA
MDVPASLLMSSGMHAYVAVKASLHASDSSVFGLSEVETNALAKRFNNYRHDIVNGVLIKGHPINVVNALGELGYRVVGTTGEAEVVWTMQRDI